MLHSNHYNKLGLNRRETFLGNMRHILSKAQQLQVQHALVATPLKEVGKHRVVDMSLGPTHSSLVVETGKVCPGPMLGGPLALSSMLWLCR